MVFFSKNNYHSIVVKILPSFRSTSLHLKSSEQTESCREGSIVKILTKSSDCYKPQCLLIAAVLRIRSAE